MKYRFIISPLAIIEIKEAIDWYETQAKGQGEKLKNLIYKKLEVIQAFPDRYPKRHGYFRETPLMKYPYLIVYRFNKRKSSIVITSVFNTNRRPGDKYHL